MTSKRTWLFFSVALLTFFLRFYRLGEVPVSLYWDEVAQGYNAYSILKTGKDEYGVHFPFYFQSFDDYKNPGLIYLSIVPIALFGLNEFSVRFTSAFLGSLTVFVTMAIAYQLGIRQGNKNTANKFSLIAGVLMGISPWHLQFSRAAFEANVGLFFLVASTWMFLLSLRRKNLLLLSLIGFILSCYFYGSFIVIAPLLFLILFFINRMHFVHNAKLKSATFIIVGLVLGIPIMYHTMSSRGLTRASQVQVFNNIQEQYFESAQKILANQNVWWARIIYNRRITAAKIVIQNYFKNFYPTFLFIKGDGNGRHSISGMGLLFWWQLPFLLCGLYRIIGGKSVSRMLLFSWLLIAPIPSAFSIPAPHALRSLPMVIPLTLFCGYGLTKCIFLKKSAILHFILFIVIAQSYGYYLFSYYFISSKAYAVDWADGYKQMAKEVAQHEAEYNKILISGYYWKPYIYMLFYNQIDPALFQEKGSQTAFEKYVFAGTSWDKHKFTLEDKKDLIRLLGTDNFLAVLSPHEFFVHRHSLQRYKETTDTQNNTRFILSTPNTVK